MVNAETGASIKLAVNPSTEESESSSGKDTVTVEGDPAEGPVGPSASRTNDVVAAPEDARHQGRRELEDAKRQRQTLAAYFSAPAGSVPWQEDMVNVG